MLLEFLWQPRQCHSDRSRKKLYHVFQIQLIGSFRRSSLLGLKTAFSRRKSRGKILRGLKMATTLTFEQDELRASPDLSSGEIAVDNKTGHPISLRDPFGGRVIELTVGPQKAAIPEVSVLLY